MFEYVDKFAVLVKNLIDENVSVAGIFATAEDANLFAENILASNEPETYGVKIEKIEALDI